VELDGRPGQLLPKFIECPYSHCSHLLGHDFQFLVATPEFVNMALQDLVLDVHFGLIHTLVHDLSVDLSDKPWVD